MGKEKPVICEVNFRECIVKYPRLTITTYAPSARYAQVLWQSIQIESSCGIRTHAIFSLIAFKNNY
jgi:hypothetical protein